MRVSLRCANKDARFLFGKFIMNNSIVFNGHHGTIIERSPHNNFLVVEITERIIIIGTFSNKWNWSENKDIISGFKAFITYIGINDENEAFFYNELIEKLGGSSDEDYRPSKRNPYFPYEIKIRGLSLTNFNQLI